MLISELIEALQEIQNEQGDLIVDVCDLSQTCAGTLEIDDVEYVSQDNTATIFTQIKDS